jgi:hypothetical protein
MEKHLLWILRVASSSYELPALPPPFPHVATPAKVSTATKKKIICNIEFIFVLNPHQNDQGLKGPCFFQRLIALKFLKCQQIFFLVNPISPSENMLFSMILTI